jgi:hypothetical protein
MVPSGHVRRLAHRFETCENLNKEVLWGTDQCNSAIKTTAILDPSGKAVPKTLAALKYVTVAESTLELGSNPSLAAEMGSFSTSTTLNRPEEESNPIAGAIPAPDKATYISRMNESEEPDYAASFKKKWSIFQSLDLNDYYVGKYSEDTLQGKALCKTFSICKGMYGLNFFLFYLYSADLVARVKGIRAPFTKPLVVNRFHQKKFNMRWPWESCSTSLLAAAFTSLDRIKWIEVQRKLICNSNHLETLSIMTAHFNTVFGAHALSPSEDCH